MDEIWCESADETAWAACEDDEDDEDASAELLRFAAVKTLRSVATLVAISSLFTVTVYTVIV